MTSSLTVWQLNRYGVLSLPLAMLGLPLFVYLPLYYSESFGLALSAIGTALLLSRLLDVVTDPLMGWLSDRLLPWVSRVQQILLAMLVLAGALYGLLLPEPSSVSFASLMMWSFFTYLAWTGVQVPYYALAAELSHEQHEKTRLTATREGWVVLGVLTILLMPFVLDEAIESQNFYLTFYPVWLALSALAMALLWSLHKDEARLFSAESTVSVFGLLARLWQQERSVFQIMPMYFVNQLANALPATLFLFFVKDYLQLGEYKGGFLMLYFVTGVLALPVWLALSKHWQKIRTWQVSMALASISFTGVFWLSPGDWVGFAVITFLTGLSLSVDMAMPASIQADIGQKAQAHVKQSVQGILFGIWGMLTKLALAVAAGLALPMLEWAQTWSVANTWPEAWPFWLLYAAIPIALKLWAAWQLERLRVLDKPV